MTSSNFPGLHAALTVYQQPDVPGDATEAAASQHCPNEDVLATPQMTAYKCDAQSCNSVKLLDTKDCEASVPLDVENESNMIAEGEVVNEEPERKAPTESAVVDIVRRLEEVLQEKGLREEGDLMGALNGGRHHMEGYDDGPRRARLSSSSSSSYESAVEEADGEQEQRSMKDGWSQVLSPPALQAMQKTCDAEAQTQGGAPALLTEMESTLQKRDAEVAKLKGRLKTLRESHAKEEQDLLVMIDELQQTPPPDPTRRAAEVKNPISKKEKPPGTNEETAQVSPRPPQPRPQLPERHPLPLARPEDKRRSLPVDPRLRSQPRSDKELSTYATSPLVHDFSELPGSKEKVAAPCSDVESMRPSKEEVPTKGKGAEQISKIVRMVKKKEPSRTDDEIRRLFDDVRRSHGGFSGMTYKAIVELILDNIKAVRREEN